MTLCSSTFLMEMFTVYDLFFCLLMLTISNVSSQITETTVQINEEPVSVFWGIMSRFWNKWHTVISNSLTFFHSILHDGRDRDNLILTKNDSPCRRSWSLLSASPAWANGTSSRMRLCPRGRVTTGGWWLWGWTARRRRTPSPTVRGGSCGRVTAAWAAPSLMPSPNSSL